MSVAVVILAVVFIAVVAVGLVKVVSKRAEARYSAAYAEAVREAEFCGSHEKRFSAGEYDGVFTVREVCHLRKVFLEAVRADAYRVGREGFPNMLEFTGYRWDADAEAEYNAGWSEGHGKVDALTVLS